MLILQLRKATLYGSKKKKKKDWIESLGHRGQMGGYLCFISMFWKVSTSLSREIPPGSWQVTGTFHPESSAGAETRGGGTHLELQFSLWNEAEQDRPPRSLPGITPKAPPAMEPQVPWSDEWEVPGSAFLAALPLGLIWFNDSWHSIVHILSVFRDSEKE